MTKMLGPDGKVDIDRMLRSSWAFSAQNDILRTA